MLGLHYDYGFIFHQDTHVARKEKKAWGVQLCSGERGKSHPSLLCLVEGTSTCMRVMGIGAQSTFHIVLYLCTEIKCAGQGATC